MKTGLRMEEGKGGKIDFIPKKEAIGLFKWLGTCFPHPFYKFIIAHLVGHGIQQV